MRPVTFTVNRLAEALQQKSVATLPELSAAMGHCSPSTVHRKLRQLDYLSSYSHNGKYYTLRTLAGFDARGLWSFGNIQFSRHGTLRSTARKLVADSPLGYRPAELDGVLKVRTIDTLAGLVRDGQLARIRFEKRSVYCSADPTRQARQIAARRIQQTGATLPVSTPTDRAQSAAIALFCSVLNEKQRRLFAGLTSLLWGYGGDRRAADLLDLNRKTVRKGRLELVTGEVDPSRIRRPGGGRTALQKKIPG